MRRMKTSTELRSAAELVGERKAIELIAKAGFDGWDFSLYEICKYSKKLGGVVESAHPLFGREYLSFARELKQIGLDNGIVCNQSHAPTPSSAAPVRSQLKRAIECTAEAGGEYCIIHPLHPDDPQANAELYWELLPFAKECGVKIATENMFYFDKEAGVASPAACATAESFNAHLDAVNDPYLVACLDIGHAEMLGDLVSATELIHALGPRLKCLHVHDNDKQRDRHRCPFTMDIDFEPICRALKEVGYDGWMTLEAVLALKTYDESNVLEGLLEMAGAALRLAQMTENA